MGVRDDLKGVNDNGSDYISFFDGPVVAFHSTGNVMKAELQKRLEALYKSYPRKLGKTRGIKIGRAQCNTPEKLDNLEKAIQNYIKHLEVNRTEAQYVLYFGTFMGQWQEWLDEDHGKVTLKIIEDELALSPEAFE